MTAVLNAANERANELFRAEKLGYLGTIQISRASYMKPTSRVFVHLCTGPYLSMTLYLNFFHFRYPCSR
jgi:hypothetical protein